MNHLYQTTGKNCGPTCLKMVFDHIGKCKDKSIADITELCNCNQKGTNAAKMMMGLKKLGIKFGAPLERTTQRLIRSLQSGKVVILRTLTHGIKHWIIAYDYDTTRDVFLINDPWLGKIEYTPEEVNAIWQPRNCFFLEIPIVQNKIKLEGLMVEVVTDNEDIIFFRNILNSVFNDKQYFDQKGNFLYEKYKSKIVKFVENKFEEYNYGKKIEKPVMELFQRIFILIEKKKIDLQRFKGFNDISSLKMWKKLAQDMENKKDGATIAKPEKTKQKEFV